MAPLSLQLSRRTVAQLPAIHSYDARPLATFSAKGDFDPQRPQERVGTMKAAVILPRIMRQA
jgi:hypothetical protein